MVSFKKFLFLFLFTLPLFCQITQLPAAGGSANLAIGNTVTGSTAGALIYADGSGKLGNLSSWLLEATGGLTQTENNPFPLTNAEGFGNLNTAVIRDVFMPGDNEPANYGNTGGLLSVLRIFNGRNASDNSDKKTQYGESVDINFMSAGQHSGAALALNCTGIGDCLGRDCLATVATFTTAGGDEGISQCNRVFEAVNELQTTISTSVTSTCSTTLSAAVTKSTTNTDFKTLMFTSSTGCNDGDWVTIDNGVYESTDNLKDTVLLHVSGGVVTAILQANHSMGAPVAGATRLTLASMPDNNAADNNLGVGRVVVETDGTTYTTGTISSVSGTTVTGSGTTWTTGMVGGTSNTAGAISFTCQNTTSTWAGAKTIRNWFPIQTVNSTTQLTLARFADVQGNPTNFSGCAYIIAPAARIEYLVTGPVTRSGGTVSTLGITAVVLESNPFTWTVGKTFDQSIPPYASLLSAYPCTIFWNGPVTGAGTCFDADNDGLTEMTAALRAISQGVDALGIPGYRYGVDLEASTESAGVAIKGRNHESVGIALTTFSASGPLIEDDKWISWNGGNATTSVYTNNVTGAFTVAPRSDTTAGIILGGVGSLAPLTNATRMRLWDSGNAFNSFVISSSNIDYAGATLDIGLRNEFSISGATTTANNSNFLTVTLAGSITDLREVLTSGDRIALSSATSSYATVTCLDDTHICTDVNLGNGTSQTINIRKAALKTHTLNTTPAAGERLVVDDRGFILQGNLQAGYSVWDNSALTAARTYTEADRSGTLNPFGNATTGAGTQTFTNSPCGTLTTAQWIPVTITGQTGTWFIPACQ